MMSNALWSPATGIEARWCSKLFYSSTTFVVPADVGAIWIDGCGGGGGGGGGDATPGGGGGGGSPAWAIRFHPCSVTPGETLTLTIGVNGTGGNAGIDGTPGGATSLVGALSAIYLQPGINGIAGANPNGGNGGIFSNGLVASVGGSGAGQEGKYYKAFLDHGYYVPSEITQHSFSSGGAGGALTYAGGAAGAFTLHSSAPIYNTSTGNSSGGGGGAGGCGPFGIGGAGGSNGAVGSNATGYGCGGGGGSGNARGGNGSPGFIRLYCLTAYTI